MKVQSKILPKILLYIPWIVSIISTLGSLYFSEILHFPPCVLCWYQRIFMYPLVAILGIGLYLKDKKVVYYALPLSVVGWAIAIYHNLLYYKFLPESVQPCIQGVSCTTVQLEWIGFITIPLLSLIAFSIITVSMLIYVHINRKQSK